MSPLGIRTWQRCMCYVLPEIPLRCDTWWPLGGWHGSQAIFFHIPEHRHCLGSTPGSITLPLPHSKRPGRHSTNWSVLETIFHTFCIHLRCLYKVTCRYAKLSETPHATLCTYLRRVQNHVEYIELKYSSFQYIFIKFSVHFIPHANISWWPAYVLALHPS